ncbi:MAG: hypothetical protein ACFHX7_08380 [Pseudomonadota bacterium]
MTKGILEKTAMVLSVAIIAGWSVFWVMQVMDVIETLRLAYG